MSQLASALARAITADPRERLARLRMKKRRQRRRIAGKQKKLFSLQTTEKTWLGLERQARASIVEVRLQLRHESEKIARAIAQDLCWERGITLRVLCGPGSSAELCRLRREFYRRALAEHIHPTIIGKVVRRTRVAVLYALGTAQVKP